MSKLSEFRKTVDEGSEKQKAKAAKLKEKVGGKSVHILLER